MLYGFVREDIELSKKRDPLLIQLEYAKKTGKYIEIDLHNNCFNNELGEIIIPEKSSILLRASCEYAEKAICFTQRNGLLPLENIQDIQKIENWVDLNITNRKIKKLSINDLAEFIKSDNSILFEKNNPNIFIKSLNKGFSAAISLKELEENVEGALNFIIKQCQEHNTQEILVSKYIDIQKDSIGDKEYRFFVINKEIANSSRNIHSLKHNVPLKFRNKAKSVIEQLSLISHFPNNYVLDIAEFCEENNNYVDVLEINPITTSLCYVNNSIFEEIDLDILQIYKVLGFGYEYCLDYQRNPNCYATERYINDNYEYVNPHQYNFL